MPRKTHRVLDALSSIASEEYRPSIVEGMADYLWFWGWMNMAVDTHMFEYDQGMNWNEVVPPTPAVAAKPAAELARLVEVTTGRSLDLLFFSMWQLQPSMGRKRIAEAARTFGQNIAAASLGVDETFDNQLDLPSFSVSFDADSNQLAWDGSADDSSMTTNPVIDRILLIEDEADRQQEMVRLLKRLYPNATTTVVDNAVDANAEIDKTTYGLIVSDFDIADGTTGGDVLDHLHDKHPELVNRFVFASGNAIVQDLHPYWIMKGEITKAALAAVIARMPVTNPSCCSECS
jgi:CheY-like chemotaxis protein